MINRYLAVELASRRKMAERMYARAFAEKQSSHHEARLNPTPVPILRNAGRKHGPRRRRVPGALAQRARARPPRFAKIIGAEFANG